MKSLRPILVVVTVLWFLLVGSNVGAQHVPDIHLPVSPGPQITISPFSEAKFPAFKDVLSAPDKVALEPASFVLTNNSQKSIYAIDAEWTLIDPDGRRRQWSFHKDNFGTPNGSAVLRPHDSLLVAPGLFLAESTAQSPHIHSDSSGGLGPTLNK